MCVTSLEGNFWEGGFTDMLLTVSRGLRQLGMQNARPVVFSHSCTLMSVTYEKLLKSFSCTFPLLNEALGKEIKNRLSEKKLHACIHMHFGLGLI